MHGKLVFGGIAALLSTSAMAQTALADLAKPPADATHYVIQSTGGKHGDSYRWTTADGTVMNRESMNLRGQVFEQDQTTTFGSDKMPAKVVIRGFTPNGDAGETFAVDGGTAKWKSQIDAGSAPYATPAYYASQGGPFAANGLFIERLLASPGHDMTLLPGGKAHAEKVAALDIGEGAAKKTIMLWLITGLSNSPTPVWTDSDDKFFAFTFGLAVIPIAYAGEQKKIEKAQAEAMSAQMPGLAKALAKLPSTPVAFVNVKLFDADARKFLPAQTVVVNNGTIVAVGPASKVKAPKGAQIFDGKGKTLVPGMWDCHMHVGDDYTGLQELSLGVTSVRDPGNNDVLTIDRRNRTAKGELLFPNVYASSLIDGKGPYTAQVANVATSQEEAIKLIDKAKAGGFIGIKFYGTFDPKWLPAAIAEAHKQGLHVHGHIPAGIRPMEAIRDGYDEITHINWIVMQGVPASVLPTDNGIGRFEAPGRYAKDMNMDGPEMTEIVNTMAKKHIYSDPTMVTFEGLYYPENGELSPAYAPFVGTLPPTSERGFRSGGFAPPKDLTRADYRASWEKITQLLTKMHKAGVPIVAGTDGSGIEIIRELEIYVAAGFTPAEALAAATIVPAQLVKADKKTGSIKVGKTADLVLVEGDPSVNIGDLRHTRTVMLGGKLMDADALRTAAGFGGRPK